MTQFRSRSLVLFRLLAGLFLVLALLVQDVPAQALPRDIVVIRTNGGSYRFNVELAVTEEERAKGLMFRQELDPGAGMLFLYNQDQAVTFWMKDTALPLDMIFIASDGKITQIVRHAEPYSENLIPSNTYIRGVLEVIAGTVDRYNIAPGDQVDYGKFKMPGAASAKTPGQ
ncbi:MAG TPA: DUF192 domain-containing protein [Dongiaceae bacterium]|nr:DUF192 domain-containing protein [Dongiaceae bacterium]